MSSPSPVDHVVETYGDLLFDLCDSVLWSPIQAQNAIRSILKEIKKTKPTEKYVDHERAWILRIAFEKLKKLSPQYARKVTASEQIELDAQPSATAKLKQFEVYLHRLTTEEKFVLLLRDKYALPYNEIADTTGIPIDTLRGVRQQALKTLETWLWEEDSSGESSS